MGSVRLIRAMLQIEPEKRITIEELCNHPWITSGFKNPVKNSKRSNVSVESLVQTFMRNTNCCIFNIIAV